MEWPTSKSETIVLPVSADEAEKALRSATKPLKGDFVTENEEELVFNGVVEKKTFKISTIIRHPDNYIPLISGTIEPTSVGAIVFIRYELFFSSKLFLIFWSSVCLLLAIFLALALRTYGYAGAALGVGLLNYSVTILNFRRRIPESRKKLLDVLMTVNLLLFPLLSFCSFAA